MNQAKFEKNKSYFISEMGDVEEWKGEHNLKSWQSAVGGYIELCPPHITNKLSEDHYLLVDEEGLFKDKGENALIRNMIVGDGLLIPLDKFE